MTSKTPLEINVFGLGYAGFVSAVALGTLGHRVNGIELDSARAKTLQSGLVPFFEPALQAAYTKVLVKKNGLNPKPAGQLRIFDRLDENHLEADISLICVGTPVTSSGEVDLHQILESVRQVSHLISRRKKFHWVFIRSTVPPGTCEKLIHFIGEKSGKSPGQHFGLVFYPEFLREGSALQDFLKPSLNIIGAENDSGLKKLLKRLRPDQKFHLTDFRTSELLKYACNSFHALKVSFANEIGSLGKTFNVNSQEIMKALAQEQNQNLATNYLLPGPPFGGSCLPKDLNALENLFLQKGVEAPLVSAIRASNQTHLNRTLSVIFKNQPSPLGIWGVTFKPDTDDIRESPMLKLINYGLARPTPLPRISIHDRPEVLDKVSKIYGDQLTYLKNKPDLLKNKKLVLGPSSFTSEDLLELEKFSGDIIDLGWQPLPETIKRKKNYYRTC